MLINSSVKNMCICFIIIRGIPKAKCVCQELQLILSYLWVNSVQVALEGTSFVDIRGTLMYRVGGGFNLHPIVTERVNTGVHRRYFPRNLPEILQRNNFL